MLVLATINYHTLQFATSRKSSLYNTHKDLTGNFDSVSNFIIQLTYKMFGKGILLVFMVLGATHLAFGAQQQAATYYRGLVHL